MQIFPSPTAPQKGRAGDQPFYAKKGGVFVIILCSLGLGYFGYRQLNEHSRVVELNRHLESINAAIQIYQKNDGRLRHGMSANEILERLKAYDANEAENMIDPRLFPIALTPDEVGSNLPRAVWDASYNRFKVVNVGPGIKYFATHDTGTDQSGKKASPVATADPSPREEWIWDYQVVSKQVTNSKIVKKPQLTVGDDGRTLYRLSTPQVSLSPGFYAYPEYNLRTRILNPNSPHNSAVMYSLNGGTTWNLYGGRPIDIPPRSATELRVYAATRDSGLYADSEELISIYETFSFSGSSHAIFSRPPDGWNTTYHSVHSPETSTLIWSDEGHSDEESYMTFRNVAFENIVPGQEFLIGELEFYNGMASGGFGDIGIERDSEVELDLKVPVSSQTLGVSLELIPSPNLAWNSPNRNADCLRIVENKIPYSAGLTGDAYSLVIRFGDFKGKGFSTADELFAQENQAINARVFATLMWEQSAP